jgi:hypothetical protein
MLNRQHSAHITFKEMTTKYKTFQEQNIKANRIQVYRPLESYL